MTPVRLPPGSDTVRHGSSASAPRSDESPATEATESRDVSSAPPLVVYCSNYAVAF